MLFRLMFAVVLGQWVHDAECSKKFIFYVYVANIPSINSSAPFCLSCFPILECKSSGSTRRSRNEP